MIFAQARAAIYGFSWKIILGEEGEEYGVITQGYTINPITGGNASQIFGGAQVEIRY